jgi:cell division protein FtsB
MSVTAQSARRTRARIRFTPRAGILALILTAMFLYMAVPLRTYISQRNRLSQLEQQAQLLQRQNARLAQEVHQLNDPAFLERTARQCLGMVRAGEIAFVVVPGGGKAQPPRC